jgi:hypothetical protein
MGPSLLLWVEWFPCLFFFVLADCCNELPPVLLLVVRGRGAQENRAEAVDVKLRHDAGSCVDADDLDPPGGKV